MIREAVSDKSLFGKPREEINYILGENCCQEDVDCIEKLIENWNFIRSLSWLFDKPKKKLLVKNFLTTEKYNNYKRMKQKQLSLQ